MVRVRSQDGTLKDIDGFEAVEILDNDGNLGLLILQDRKKTVRILNPGDALFKGYCATQGIRAANVHIHEPLAMKPALRG